MNSRVPLIRLVGTSLLGVIATVALVVAVLMLYAAWVIARPTGAWFGDVGTAATALIAVLLLAYAAVAAYAAREEWRGEPIGRAIGLGVAIVTILAAAITLLVGNVAESTVLLYLAIGLGAATAIPMLLPDAPGGQ